MKFCRENLIFIILFCSHIAMGQLEITFPAERAIFQRNNGNAAIVYITGHYRAYVDKIEARFIPIQGGNATNWNTISNYPNSGYFRGSMVVSGGWYELEVRASRNGEVLFESQVSKVGVGEVFLIAGQSNAQGYNNYGQRGAEDDRVNVISNHFSLGREPPQYPSFGRLEAESKIAPTGNGAWCWGELGDLLANRLNVPILFINSAWEGYEVAQFVRSSFGESGLNPYSRILAPAGYPFNSMSNALHYYTNLTGVRSILWHQGETDNYLGTDSQTYSNQLRTLINQTRSVTGKNLSWVIARVSKDQNRYYPPVIDGQNQVIQSTENVFQGPNTDEITDRRDGVHFSVNGLRILANAWFNSLDQNFFAYSQPQFGNPPLQLNQSCDPLQDLNQPVTIRAPQGYSSYSWSNGGSSYDTQVGAGNHQGYAKDRFGNVYYSSPIRIPDNILPEKPSISATGSTTFCAGQSVELRANKENNLYWNVNQSGPSIRASNPGIYKVTYVNFYNCGTESDPIVIENYPTVVPQVVASGPTEICSDEELTLSSNVSKDLIWNNGASEPTIKVTESGKYYATATNEFGCTGKSQEIDVLVKPAAEKPTVFNQGSEEFCQNDSTKLSVNSFDDFEWNTGAQLNQITVKQSGTYYVTAKNEFDCIVKSNEVFIKVNPTPDKPEITAQGPTTFCDDSTVVLIASNATSYEWSNGSVQKEISLNQSSDLFLRVRNEFDCISPPSDMMRVTALPTPKNPNIIQSGTFTLSASFSGDTSNINYLWKLGDDFLDNNKPTLKAKKQGDYSVIGTQSFQLENNSTLTCTSLTSEKLFYMISEDNKGYSVYPNPNYINQLKIETLEDVDNATVSVYDLTGKLYRTYFVPLFDEIKVFDLKGIPSGDFIVKIKNNRTNFTSKLLIR